MPTVERSISFATSEDSAQILALVESAYRGPESLLGWTTEADLLAGQRTDESEICSQLSRGDTRILRMQEGGAIVASILLQCEGKLGYVGMFAVRPSVQGQGLGRQLLNAAEQVLRDQFGATKVQMTVIRQRSALIAWYERRGYSLTGKTMPFPYGNERMGLPKRDDLEFIVLEKPLT